MALSFLGMIPSGIYWAYKSARGKSEGNSLHRRVFTGCALGWVVLLTGLVAARSLTGLVPDEDGHGETFRAVSRATTALVPIAQLIALAFWST